MTVYTDELLFCTVCNARTLHKTESDRPHKVVTAQCVPCHGIRAVSCFMEEQIRSNGQKYLFVR